MRDISITSAAVLDRPDEPKRRGNRATRVPAILEVAISVFAAEGNAGFTQRRVADEAGIHLKTLQHYFGTKEELLRATIEEMSTRYLESFRGIINDAQRPPEARIEAVVHEMFSSFSRLSNGLSTFAMESWVLAERDEFVHRIVADKINEFENMFAELVANMNPALTAEECGLRGALLVSHLHGLIVYMRRAREKAPDAAAFLRATKAVWMAISRAPE